jgi:hypothetical protein
MGTLTTSRAGAMSAVFLLLALFLGTTVQAQHFLQSELASVVSNATIGNCQQAVSLQSAELILSLILERHQCAQLQAPTTLPPNFAQGYFATQQQEIKPLCVVQPESPGDVSRIVQVVREHQCQFAVKGGGHGNHAGASNIQDGLLIDMSRINRVTLSVDESIAGIGAGARWIDVYEVLEEKGLAVVGGRASTVGVAGFTLGGIYIPVLSSYPQHTSVGACSLTPSSRRHILPLSPVRLGTRQCRKLRARPLQRNTHKRKPDLTSRPLFRTPRRRQ